MKRIFSFITFIVLFASASAQSVEEPNGQVTGFVGPLVIDLPVRCEGSPVQRAYSHDERSAPSLILGLPTGPSRYGLVDVQTETDEIYIGVEPSNDGFPTTFAGEADGISFELTLDCESTG